MKKKYEKPIVKIVEMEMTGCIATASFTLKQGQTVHQNLNGSDRGRTWGETFELDDTGRPCIGGQD